MLNEDGGIVGVEKMVDLYRRHGHPTFKPWFGSGPEYDVWGITHCYYFRSYYIDHNERLKQDFCQFLPANVI